MSVGSLIWNLPTESGEPLWLDREREVSVFSHTLQTVRALSLRPAWTVEVTCEGHQNQHEAFFKHFQTVNYIWGFFQT